MYVWELQKEKQQVRQKRKKHLTECEAVKQKKKGAE